MNKQRVLSACWPEGALGALLQKLVLLAQMPRLPTSSPGVAWPAAREGQASFELEVERIAEQLGVATKNVETTVSQGAEAIEAATPCVVAIQLPNSSGENGYLAILRGRRNRLQVVAPDGRLCWLAGEQVVQLMNRHVFDQVAPRVESWMAATGVRRRRAGRVRAALTLLICGQRRVSGVVSVCPDPGSSFLQQLRWRKLGRPATAAVALALGQVVASLLAWVVLARNLLSGEVTAAWVVTWVLLLLTGLVAQSASQWYGGIALQELVVALRQRLLCGALRLPGAELRSRGPTELNAAVAELETFDAAIHGNVFGVLGGLIQLGFAALVLSLGNGGNFRVLLLAAWCGVVTVCAHRYFLAAKTWLKKRFLVSKGIAAQVHGHQTITMQGDVRRWHIREERIVQECQQSAFDYDRLKTVLVVLPARGWLVLAFIALLPSFIGGQSGLEFAIGLAGTVLAFSGLRAVSPPLGLLVDCVLAWRAVRRQFYAAGCKSATPAGMATEPANREEGRDSRMPLLDVRNVGYDQRGAPFDRLNLTLRRGDRAVITGDSGEGKSTLAQLLGGLLSPSGGHVLVDGLDRPTWGARQWRTRVASIPQFQDNYLFSTTLAFNLLMARRWPPSEADLRDAERVCHALGLSTLLKKMPAGLNQLVGETGWQLSQGERARVFLARALMQNPLVLILDETLAALDPETSTKCLEIVEGEVPAVLLIAHP